MEKKERAEQSARVRQEFLSTMSHEIRTPLNAVTTITSLLKAKADLEETELLNSLKFASNNLLMIINDILDFTKLDTGKVSLDLHPCKFRVLLENIRKTYDSLAKEKGLRLSLAVDDAVNDCYELDETKLSQILGNLIGNAIKYTELGEVIIYVEKLSGDDADLIRFRVKDTGVGIAPVYLDQIFSSFFQPKSVTTRKQGGSGLGLAIVKKLVELHDSKIEVTSEEGAGSEFYFTLKLRKSIVPAETPVKRSPELKNKLVLLAEDNTINAMVARRLLSNWGMLSEHAKNGADAVELSNTRRFDFILMDIHMPEMNGFDAAKQIRCTENLNKDTPIFALTADIVAELDESNTSYFSGFLLKPIEIDKLYEALTGYVA
jgi:CheY-like chemotaxis protein